MENWLPPEIGLPTILKQKMFVNRINIGKISVDFLPQDTILERIKSFITHPNNKPHQIVTLNSIMYNYTYCDKQLEEAIKSASLVLSDSLGITIAGYALSERGKRNVKRVPGIDLTLKICQLAQLYGYKIFLLGAKPDIIPLACLNLKKLFPKLNIVGFYHGYFDRTEEKNIIQQIIQQKPDVLFVGLNVPHQEKWIYKNLTSLNVPVVMGIGGSFDVISGRLRRAPEFTRHIGLEWFFRFLQQPWRIKRIKDLPIFVYRIFKTFILQKLSKILKD